MLLVCHTMKSKVLQAFYENKHVYMGASAIELHPEEKKADVII